MNRHGSLVVTAALLILAVSLAGCRPPGGALPVCEGWELLAPESLSPGGLPSTESEIVDTLTPTFSWTYPGTSCRPDSYVLTISTSWMGLESAREVGIITGSEYTPSDPLLPGTTYIWRVAAVAPGGERAWRHNGIFRTGPMCDEAWSRSLEIPLLLSPANGARLATLHPELEWDDPTPCIPAGNYNVEIDTTPRFDDPLIGQYPEPYLWVNHPWVDFDLGPCTTYYWRVAFALSDYPDQPTPYSQTWSFTTGAEAGTICPPTIPLITPIPGSGALPEAMAREDASCRVGPSTQFNIAAYLMQGQVVPITGRLAEGGWWQVQPPDIQIPCWIAEGIVEPYGDLTQVPIAIAPALPTEEPTEEPPQGCWCQTPQQCCAHFDVCPAACKSCPSPTQICQ